MKITSIGTNYTPSKNNLHNFRGVFVVTNSDKDVDEYSFTLTRTINAIYRPHPNETKPHSIYVMEQFNGEHQGSETHEHLYKTESRFTCYYNAWYDCNCELGNPLTKEEIKKYGVKNANDNIIVYKDGKKEKFTKDTFHANRTIILS